MKLIGETIMTSGDILINEGSLQYILGSIDQRLKNGDEVMSRLTEAIDRLPCAVNSHKIKELEDDRKRRYSFADTLKITIISSAIAALLGGIAGHFL